VLFSTDISQSPDEIYRFYKLRFQIEFIFRDAKQFTGLSDCQARDVKKLDFHFNASFTALNLAKLDAHQQQSAQKPLIFSMASVKRRALNDHLLDTFISMLDLSPTVIKSHPNYQNLRAYGVIAA
nr:transposase [Dendronalium phyllosphericum CENA369]